jgi:hypothetical protein
LFLHLLLSIVSSIYFSHSTVYTRAGDENSPGQTESNSVQSREEGESDESSPRSLSNKIPSGPYIPISECFSGKTIPKSEMGDVTYCNSSVFQFPPKVNWATHPSKRDTDSDATPTPTPTSADASSSLYSASALAPPRPPKSKANGSPISISVTSPSSASAVPEPLTSPTVPFDHEEAPDSSSTCSSLHSPPSSAGAVYCNIAELNEQPKPRSSILSCGPVKRNPNIPPPVVDRNLKPLKRREGFEADRDRVSPTNNLPAASYVSGTQTLPSRGGQYNRSNGFSAGPIIDRTRKPPDGTLSLGPTPAQIKSHGQSNQSLSASYNQKTLPSSPRRAGPMISPGNDKRPVVYHEYEQAHEMRGTYMQIDCQMNKDAESPKPKTIKPGVARKGPGTPNSNDPNGFVEYRLIDPVKTKALNRTIEDREKQLRNNTLSKSHH